ncbi:MAG: fibronectin type III domain-containing protein [Ignavibacteria bacterium]|nr:fibronectin type III domain-containing protein [Ignavibacteria bacterium]MBK6419748.1 fibronectin type III domain-containing protein [Ignavibacteria bacterium]MBK6759621.1 fibronectin type III domain-containing protein [Ignavibacteria bacterium]MBK7184513.1 fibronectin type III domain-containing protein [Ignavibacteria bacterium]MBK7576809.1 fibronectin type III domain-containing protein [Ignavibacteria bacterium]
MKNIFRLNIVMAAIAALVMVGCNTNEDPLTPTPTKPSAPSGTMAQSASATSIRLKWTLPTSTTDVTGYVLMAIEKVAGGTGAKREVIVSGAGSTTGVVGGLTEGKIYECMVHALNDTVRSDASPSVDWAPARRSTASIRLYSKRSSTNGSGLGIFGLADPASLFVANGSQWDVCFDDSISAQPRIGSPGVSSYVDADNGYTFKTAPSQVAKIVYVSDRQYTGISSLDDIYETSALAIPATNGEKLFEIPTTVETSDFGFVIGSKGAGTDVNFAKILVKRGADGKFIQGTGTETYIECDISYQTFANVPYALKARINETIKAHGTRVYTPAR